MDTSVDKSQETTPTQTPKGSRQLKMADVDDIKMEEKGNHEPTTTVRSSDEGGTFYQRHKTVIWIVIALLVFAVAAGIGVGIAKALEDNLDYHKSVWYRGTCPRDYKTCPKDFDDKAPLIIVGLNGFTGDMFSRKVVPNIYKLRDCGAHTPNMSSMFPLSAFPNYYTVATGLYPDEHGVVDDYVLDEDFDAQFVNGTDYSQKEDPAFAARWYKGQPIWTTVRKHHMKSASFRWPGADVPINGWLPNYYVSGRSPRNFNDQVDKVVDWLKMKKKDRPNLIMLFFNASAYGDFRSRQNELRAVDKAVGRLMGGLVMLKLKNCANVMLYADYLLTNRSCGRMFALENYIRDVDNYQITPDWLNGLKRVNFTLNPYGQGGGVAFETPETTVDRLKCKNEFVQAYTKENLPARLHYAHSYRIEDVIIVGARGYSLRTKDNFNRNTEEGYCSGVAPQYYFKNLTSRVLFVGNGYSFNRDYAMSPFRSVELYNVMAELLNIKPEKNNGTEGSLRDALTRPKGLNTTLERIARPLDGSFPSGTEEYNFQLASDSTECRCEDEHLDNYFDIQTKDIQYFDTQRLNLDGNGEIASQREHAPWGVPTIFNLTHEQPGNYTLIYNREYIVGWDNYLKAPKFVSFTLEKRYSTRSPNFKEIKHCIRQDVRLMDAYEPKCSDYRLLNLHNITMGFLMHPTKVFTMEEQMDTLLTSNTVPMYVNFYEGIYEFLTDKLYYWADEFNGINVIVGPIFDSNHDGLLDKHSDLATFSAWVGNTPMPTHFFVILTRCSRGTQVSQYCRLEDREYMSSYFHTRTASRRARRRTLIIMII
ncbi:ectonucleotide pyrophosphatase/phosphodiesterase family member 3-like [Ptychodera flava]|uniref:ectonucleotide pyrophosphatase/phosphodiesterase family member 3-like n=1 Tax=Ptychodera flava TaxID=63121 RepID=UPI00396A6DD6